MRQMENLRELYQEWNYLKQLRTLCLDCCSKVCVLSCLEADYMNHANLKCFGHNSKLTYSDTIFLMVQLAIQRQLHSIRLIDSNSLKLFQLTHEEDIIKYVYKITHECKQYVSSMIIFDLDSLLDCRKEYSGLKNELKHSDDNIKEVMNSSSSFSSEPTLSYTINKPELFKAIIEETKIQTSLDNHWIVFVSSNPYITSKLKEYLEWPDTPTQIEMMKRKSALYEPKICKHCGEEYCEAENNSNSCGVHKNNVLYYDQFNQPRKILSKEQAEMEIINATILPCELRWICCGRSFYDKGEKPQKHEPIE